MPTLRAVALPLLVLLVSPRAFAQAAAPAAPSESQPAPGPSDTSAKQEAARRFEQAIKLYEDGDYTLALAEFERVYELVPDYRVLYNIGQVSIQLGRYARAFRTLKEYVSRGGSELSPDRAAAVQADLAQLTGKVAQLSVEVAQDGAQISVDGVAVGHSPLAAPLVVDVGEHRVQVELSGFTAQTRTLTLAGGDTRDASFVLRSAEAPKAAPTPTQTPRENPSAPPTPPRTASQRPTWLAVGWASTGVLAAGAIVSGALGASAASDLHDLRNTPTTRGALDQAQTRASTRLLVSDIFAASALVAGGVTLYFQLSGPSHEKAPPTAAMPRLKLLLGANGVTFAVDH